MLLTKQVQASSEKAALQVDLAALDASICSLEAQLQSAEASNLKGW